MRIRFLRECFSESRICARGEGPWPRAGAHAADPNPEPQFPHRGGARPPGRRGPRGPAPGLPGFRLPGHVPGAPPEAPAGPRGGDGDGGDGGAEVGCTAPRPHPRPPRPGAAGGPRPRAPGPGPPRLPLARAGDSPGAGLPARPVTWTPRLRSPPPDSYPSPSCGQRGQPRGFAPSSRSGGRRSALGTGHAPDVAVSRRQSPARGREGCTTEAGGHRQAIRHRPHGAGGCGGRYGIEKPSAQPHPGASPRRPRGLVKGAGKGKWTAGRRGCMRRGETPTVQIPRWSHGDGASGGSEQKRKGSRRR